MEFHLVPAGRQLDEPEWDTPDAECTVLDSWWWRERPSETRRVLNQNKINLRYCASIRFYYRKSPKRSFLHFRLSWVHNPCIFRNQWFDIIHLDVQPADDISSLFAKCWSDSATVRGHTKPIGSEWWPARVLTISLLRRDNGPNGC